MFFAQWWVLDLTSEPLPPASTRVPRRPRSGRCLYGRCGYFIYYLLTYGTVFDLNSIAYRYYLHTYVMLPYNRSSAAALSQEPRIIVPDPRALVFRAVCMLQPKNLASAARIALTNPSGSRQNRSLTSDAALRGTQFTA